MKDMKETLNKSQQLCIPTENIDDRFVDDSKAAFDNLDNLESYRNDIVPSEIKFNVNEFKSEESKNPGDLSPSSS